MIDVSNDAYLARMAIVETAAFQSAPHVLMRPRVFADGTMWCCLYGEDLQIGVAGFGETPAAACQEFDTAWWHQKTPAAQIKARKENAKP